jgi:N-methylhydantoinase A/oxoprolinase/acetone carboxylase beta subunit
VRIGVDAGGTFTDFVVLRDDGTLDVFKLRSDPTDPAGVILAGIRRAAAGVRHADVTHGSTVATNALLERKGARTAFITSPGFRDLPAIGRQNRTSLYSLLPEERVNLVPSELRLEWSTAGAWEAFLADQRPQSVAICLLNSYLDSSERNNAPAFISAGLPPLPRSFESTSARPRPSSTLTWDRS